MYLSLSITVRNTDVMYLFYSYIFLIILHNVYVITDRDSAIDLFNILYASSILIGLLTLIFTL